jgi:hypothetical protein
MKKHFYFVFLLTLIFSIQISAQLFTRTAEIKEAANKEVGGFGGVIAGVDFDKDGKTEIYVCNTNQVDRPDELIPRIYKFEWNKTTSKWDEVWSAVAPLANQNTWPAFTWGDLDKDGRPEIYWAPVNFSPYPEVARILVYEYTGTGDEMGVPDGLGGYMPNAMTTIIAGTGKNLRPVRFVIADPDADGKDELIFCDRAPLMHLGVLSVDVIPNNGGGTEKWTIEYTGEGNAGFTGSSGKYDVTVLNNVVYVWDSGSTGRVFGVKYSGGAWQPVKAQLNVATGKSSFKGTKVVDINNDGTKEILLAEWFDATKGAGAKVWLVRQAADTLTATELVDLEPHGAVRLNGAGAGDLDKDGKLDFICGSRYDANNTRKVPIFRVEYQGGDIATKANYVATVIDSAYWTKNGDLDVIEVANLDGDSDDEVLYTQGYTRGNANDDRMPLIILDRQFTPVSVEQNDNEIPTAIYLEQNYPNPFNPTTQIKFGLSEGALVQLKVFDILGREVSTLVNNEYMNPGTYTAKFNGNNLSSGVYIYSLKVGNNIITKKMQLIK